MLNLSTKPDQAELDNISITHTKIDTLLNIDSKIPISNLLSFFSQNIFG